MRSVSSNGLMGSIAMVLMCVCWVISVTAWGEEGGGYVQTWGFTGASATVSGQKFILTATVGYPDAGVASGEFYSMTSGISRGTVSTSTVGFGHIARFARQWLEGIDGLAFDLDGSGDVDFLDYTYLADKWLEVCAADWP